MPYTVRKQKCKQSSGKRGSYVLSYTDKKGKKHRACHTSRKRAQGQIAAIEAEGVEENTMELQLSELRRIIRDVIIEIKTSGEESKKKSKKNDVTGDGKADFADVMASRMMASGLPKEDAIEKAEKVTSKPKKN